MRQCLAPAARALPAVLGGEWTWQRAGGDGEIVSWVVYHHVYHEAFRSRVPYNVGLVELAEGPRLITKIVGEGRTKG